MYENVLIFSIVSHLQEEELLSPEYSILFCYIMLVKTPVKYIGQNGSLIKYMWPYLNIIGLRACLLNRPKLDISAKI